MRSRVTISPQEEAVTQRLYYNGLAAETISQHRLLGVGIGQSVAELMRAKPRYPALFYQPVHNLYLLVASETGLLGLLFFLGWLGTVLWRSRSHPFLLVPCLLLLVAGLFDHFFWTLQQGSLLFWLAASLTSVDI